MHFDQSKAKPCGCVTALGLDVGDDNLHGADPLLGAPGGPQVLIGVSDEGLWLAVVLRDAVQSIYTGGGTVSRAA